MFTAIRTTGGARTIRGTCRVPRLAPSKSDRDSELDSESDWPVPALRPDECPLRGIKSERNLLQLYPFLKSILDLQK